MSDETYRSQWGNKIPKCNIGLNHSWKEEESGICVKCGYDAFDECYKELQNLKEAKNDV